MCDPLHTRLVRLPTNSASNRADAVRSPWEGRIMRHAMPTRWIEEAESRRVLTLRLSERMPTPPRYWVTEDVASLLPTRLRSWLAARHPLVWPVSLARLH